MAQASSFKSSIRYHVCNSTAEPEHAAKPADDDLREITVASPSSNHQRSSAHRHFTPLTAGDRDQTSSTESDLVKPPVRSSSLRAHGSSSSVHSHSKPVHGSSQQASRHSSTASSARDSVLPVRARQATPGSSANETSASKVTGTRRNSTAALPSSPSRASNENANLFAAYQGDYIRQSRQLRKARRQDIKARFEKFDLNSPTSRRSHTSRRFTFIFDPSGRLTYWWTSIISLAFLYNFWIIIFRFSFHELTHENLLIWFICDYSCDFLYLMDIMFNFRTAYLEEGVLQTDPIKLRHYYMNTTRFYIDCLCLMPLDFLYLSIGFKSIVRVFRLVKIYRFWTFLDRTERHTNYPNLFRTIVLIHYLLAIFHWNACLIYILHTRSELGFTKRFSFTFDDSGLDYFKALYWSISALTLTQNHETKPTSREDYIFLSIELVFALLLFATIMGHVASIVSNLSNARKDFQAKLDAVKTYMSLRRVPSNLEDRVIRWFDYLWMSHKSVDDNQVLSLLPYKLRAEIAIHVHLDTLKRVEIFQNTEAGFLNELVLRLKPVLFSPGDFICRKGEVGREMYIVNRGKLHVMADNNKTVLATLKAGSYFGEISILNMGSGNRRTASVRSVGYSDLFCLSKEDLWEVLKEYPAVRVKLEAIAVKRLEKHKKPLIQQVNLKRSKSAPGLVEASCRLPFYVPIRRIGSGIRHLATIEETDVPSAFPNTLPIYSAFDPGQQQQQRTLSSNSLLTAAPLASSVSVTSSLTSARQPAINHSMSWSQTTDMQPADAPRVGRTVSLNHNDMPRGTGSIVGREIDRLRQRLLDLEKEELSLNSAHTEEYLETKSRLRNLEEKQFSSGR